MALDSRTSLALQTGQADPSPHMEWEVWPFRDVNAPKSGAVPTHCSLLTSLPTMFNRAAAMMRKRRIVGDGDRTVSCRFAQRRPRPVAIDKLQPFVNLDGIVAGGCGGLLWIRGHRYDFGNPASIAPRTRTLRGRFTAFRHSPPPSGNIRCQIRAVWVQL